MNVKELAEKTGLEEDEYMELINTIKEKIKSVKNLIGG